MITIDRQTTPEHIEIGADPDLTPLNQVPNGTLRSHRLFQGQVFNGNQSDPRAEPAHR